MEPRSQPASTPFTSPTSAPRLQVDGKLLALPFQLDSRLRAYLSGPDVVVTAASGLSLAFDGNSYVRLRVPAAYAGALCGLCGNYNQDSDDDLKEVGEDPARWQVGGAAGCGECVPGPCPTPCTPEQQKPFGSADACGVISAPDGPLAPCHDLVPPAQYFQACLLDACQAQGHPGGLCPAVATYVAACQAAGAQLGEWRRPDFCREYSVMHGPHSGGAGSPCLPFTGLWDKSLLFLGLRHHPASDEPDSSCRTPWHSHTEIHQVTTAVGETWTHPVRNPGSNRLLDTPGQKP